MSDHAEAEGGHETLKDHEYARETAPQSAYTNREVGIGLVIALAGMVLVFVVPLLLA